MTLGSAIRIAVGTIALTLAFGVPFAQAQPRDGHHLQLESAPPDAFERAVARMAVGEGVAPPDAFERAMVRSGSPAAVGSIEPGQRDYPGDHTVGVAFTPSTSATNATGSDVEWAQLGVGIAIGICLGCLLLVSTRMARGRHPAMRG